MKKLLFVSSVVAALLFSGCAYQQPNLVLAPVGPAPIIPQTTGTTGTLVVYSAFETGAHFYDPPYKRRYTDYKIYSPEGKLFQKVHNDNENVLDGPVWVKLPPGTYRVVACANKYGDVTVPVLIAPQKVTAVHLEGGANGPTDAADAVRLPNGQTVGWRASTDQP